MPVITISRQFGAGGHTLGEHLAERLGYQLMDRDIVAAVAKEANVSIDWVEAVEKEAGGLLMKMVHGLVSASFIERLLGDSASDFDEKKYVQFVSKVVTNIAEKGDAVVIGRGSQFFLPDDKHIVKVLLVAELADRIKFMMDHYNLTKTKAEMLVMKEEKRRSAFLKLFDSRDPDDPSIYSLVLNTSKIGLEEAEVMITDLIGHLVDESAKPIW